MSSEIIRSDCGVTGAALDPEHGAAIVHFFVGFFGSDGRANEYYQCRQPLITRHVLADWNLRTYTTEMFAVPQRGDREWGKSLGYRLLEYVPNDLRTASVPDGWGPFLWVATRHDAEFDPGYATALLFAIYAAPRFAFTAREEHVLRLAFEDATDLSIARILRISEPAVKKYFRTIYEKEELRPYAVREDRVTAAAKA